MPDRAQVVHQLPGRTRVRIPGRARDEAFFRTLAEQLAGCPGVQRVEARPRTGSFVVIHDGSFDDVVRSAFERNLFRVVGAIDKGVETSLERIALELRGVDEKLRQESGGKWGLGTVAFWGLVGAGALQVVRGNVLPAATALFAQALNILNELVDLEEKLEEHREEAVH